MKILHICISNLYVDDAGYQENLLTKMHKKMGLEVKIITCCLTYDTKGSMIYREPHTYLNSDDIEIVVLPFVNNLYFCKVLRICSGLYREIELFSPDMIFTHGTTFYGINDIVKYKKKHMKVILFGDQHGDFYNTGLSVGKSIKYFRRLIYITLILGHYTRKYSKYCETIYGVTPQRVIFLQKILRIKPEKTSLLIMGGDDSEIQFYKKEQIRNEIRAEYKISQSDFLIISGGKIDKTKNIHLLIKAVSDLNIKRLKLIVFGHLDEETNEIIKKTKNLNVILIGWIPSRKVYDYYLASDLAVFPGTHSVLWEQACSCGIPCLFKHWEGMHHVDVGGNCAFLYTDSDNEIKNAIYDIFINRVKYENMKKAAVDKCIKTFSYSEIAKRSLNHNQSVL